ncbi:MAG TPA: hypothetical protein VGO18_14135 [Steroidobacteraceae bacterium]|jgi:hypothetical protein|nr:hypothetical protein [Steroidobacteraceae bacterium]
MKAVLSLARELVGLFVDDGSLALAVLAIVVFSAALAGLGAILPGALLLLFGSLAVLAENVWRFSCRERGR